MNGLKTMVLMVTLTLMLVFVGGLLGGKSGMTFALIMAFGINFITYWFSDKIVLKMYGAKQVTEAEAPELYSMVRRLSQRAELPMPKVYVMEQDQPNAFATGRNPQHGAVAVTTGIVRILSREELEGVIGHELAHIKHRDILVSTVAATIAGAGMAAHLAGVIAANTTLPVIGVPLKSSALNGVDALYSTVQMPPGIPVATVAIDGAKNAAYLACSILSIKYPAIADKLEAFREKTRQSLVEKSSALKNR